MHVCLHVCLCMKMHACVFVEVAGQPEIPSSEVSLTSLRQGLSLPGAHQIGPGVPEILLSLSLPLSDHKHKPLSLTFKCRFWRPGAGTSVCEASALSNELSAQSLRYSFSPGFHDACLIHSYVVRGEDISPTWFLWFDKGFLAFSTMLSDMKQFMQCFPEHTCLLAKNSELKYWPRSVVNLGVCQ